MLSLQTAATWSSRSSPPALASSTSVVRKGKPPGQASQQASNLQQNGAGIWATERRRPPMPHQQQPQGLISHRGARPPIVVGLAPFPPPQRADLEDMDALSGHSLTQASQGDSTARGPAIKVWVASPRKPHGQTLFPKTSGPLCDLRSPLEFRPPRLRLTSTYIRTGLTPVRGLGLRSLSLTWSPEGKHR